MLRAAERWFVGPDNGLFHILARRDPAHACRHIRWAHVGCRRASTDATCLRPVAARLALGEVPESEPTKLTAPDGEWPDDLLEVIYIDHFGNVITGMRAKRLKPEQSLKVHHHIFRHAHTFSDVPVGQGFWYENSNGLVEIAVNRGHAAQQFGLKPGDCLVLM